MSNQERDLSELKVLSGPFNITLQQTIRDNIRQNSTIFVKILLISIMYCAILIFRLLCTWLGGQTAKNFLNGPDHEIDINEWRNKNYISYDVS